MLRSAENRFDCADAALVSSASMSRAGRIILDVLMARPSSYQTASSIFD
jgi:hypothetical protein